MARTIIIIIMMSTLAVCGMVGLSNLGPLGLIMLLPAVLVLACVMIRAGIDK